MAVGAKRANSDYEINIEGPKEELSVVAEQPRDLSPNLELSMTRNKPLADAFNHLGNIVENANDLNRKINADDFSIDLYDREEKQKIMLDQYEKAADLRLTNQVSDMHMQMKEEVLNAVNQARINGTPTNEAAMSVMERYRESFSDSFEGSRKWSNIYNSEIEQTNLNTIASDYQIEQAKMFYNMDQTQADIFRDVAMGNLDIDGGFAKLITQTKDVKNSVHAEDYIKGLGEAYNQLVISKALNLEKVANMGNTAEVANAIRSLITTNGSREYPFTDEATGKPLMGSDGKPVSFEARLTPKTVETLLKTADELESKVASAGSAGASKSLEEFKERVGGADMEKNGVSDYLMEATPTVAENYYRSTLQNIQNDPNMSPKQKTKALKGIADYYYSVVEPTVYAHHAMTLNPNARTNKRKLQEQLTALDKALGSGENMQDYAMNFSLDDGSTFSIKPPIDYTVESSTTPQDAAHNMWKRISVSMHRALKAESAPDFMYGTNNPYTTAINSAISSSQRDLILNSQEGKYWANGEGMKTLVGNLKQAKQYYIDSAGSSGTYSQLPKAFTDNFISEYNNCVSKKQQVDYARSMASCLSAAGYSELLVSPELISTKSEKDKEAILDLQREIYLSAPGLSGARAAVTHHAMQGKGRFTEKDGKEYLKTIGIEDSDAITTMINDAMKTKAIPTQYQESMRDTLNNVVIAYGTMSLDKTKQVSTADIKTALRTIVDSNFKNLDSKYVKTSIYRGNPALIGTDGIDNPEREKKLSATLNKVGDTTFASLKKLGKASSSSDIELELNGLSGNIQVKVAGNYLGLSNNTTGSFSKFVSVPYNYDKLTPNGYTKERWDSAVADYIAGASTLSFSATNSQVTGMADRLKDPITGAKVDSGRLLKDSVLLLTVMQKDNFLSDYADLVSSGESIGYNPAPSYIKTALGKPRAEGFDTAGGTGVGVSADLSKMLDYSYAKMTAYNKVDTTVNKPLSYGMRGYDFAGVMTVAKRNGYTINRDYDPANVVGVSKSSHNRGMALDFGINSNKMIDPITGYVSVQSMDNFTNMLTKNSAYASKVKYVLTSRPELLDNKPQYAAYAKFRALKGSDGKPLFRDARAIDKKLLVRNHHDNHFHVEFKEQVVGKDHGDFINAYKALATDMSKTATTAYSPVSNQESFALLKTFGNNYSNKDINGKFGMANMTKKEYENLGITEGSLFDPTIQARALTNRYQLYSDLLGNRELAVYALAGARFISSSDNKIYSVQEMLVNGKRSTGNEKFFVVPASKAAEQVRINDLVNQYKRAMKNAER